MKISMIQRREIAKTERNLMNSVCQSGLGMNYYIVSPDWDACLVRYDGGASKPIEFDCLQIKFLRSLVPRDSKQFIERGKAPKVFKDEFQLGTQNALVVI